MACSVELAPPDWSLVTSIRLMKGEKTGSEVPSVGCLAVDVTTEKTKPSIVPGSTLLPGPTLLPGSHRARDVAPGVGLAWQLA